MNLGALLILAGYVGAVFVLGPIGLLAVALHIAILCLFIKK